MELLKASSVRSDEIPGNHSSDVGQLQYHVEKEKPQEDFSIFANPRQKLH